MKFIAVHNIDRKADEFVNAAHISRIREVPVAARDEKKCTVSFSSGDTMTALGTAEELLAKIAGTSQ